jgi:predicted DNA binding CopG/RHH family protein
MRIQDGWELMPVKTGRTNATKTQQARKRVIGGKHPITITIAPELLRKVDAAAAGKGMSRAAYIAMALSYSVDHGIFK